MKRAIFLSVLLMIFSLAVSVQKEKTDFCPAIAVTGPSEVTYPGETMTFSVNVESENYKQLKYSWKIDKGTIIAGQGTEVITFDGSGLLMVEL